MTDQMELLSRSLSINLVPESWEKVAYFSRKNLVAWFDDLILRNKQLQAWSNAGDVPKSLTISYLFIPMSFLTAIMQVTARQNNLPLDNVLSLLSLLFTVF